MAGTVVASARPRGEGSYTNGSATTMQIMVKMRLKAKIRTRRPAFDAKSLRNGMIENTALYAIDKRSSHLAEKPEYADTSKHSDRRLRVNLSSCDYPVLMTVNMTSKRSYIHRAISISMPHLAHLQLLLLSHALKCLVDRQHSIRSPPILSSLATRAGVGFLCWHVLLVHRSPTASCLYSQNSTTRSRTTSAAGQPAS
jgi:hypothetical protein